MRIILSVGFFLYSLVDITQVNFLLAGYFYSGLLNPKLGCVHCFGFVVLVLVPNYTTTMGMDVHTGLRQSSFTQRVVCSFAGGN